VIVIQEESERELTEVDANLLRAFPGLRLLPTELASPERSTVADMMDGYVGWSKSYGNCSRFVKSSE
jgi:hypothetical protein